MKYIRLSGTDLEVSRIAMGCWPLAGDATWGEQPVEDSIATVHAALDAGVNFFDSAEMYGEGRSDEILGRALAGHRHDVLVAGKPRPQDMKPRDLIASCERTLKRLKRDHLDLYQIHWPSREVPLEDSWEAMRRLRDQGKVRAIAVCNFGPQDLEQLLRLDRPATNQLPYNLLTRGIEDELLPLCHGREIGVLCYSPLHLGLLTGKFASPDQVPPGRARDRHFRGDRPQSVHGEKGCEKETFRALEEIRRLAADLGCAMADLALAWLLHQKGVSAVLTGARRPGQITDNTRDASLKLPQAAIDRLAEVTDPVKKAMGTNLDLCRSGESSRYQ